MAEKTPLNYQSIPKIKLLQAVGQKLFKNVNPCQSNSVRRYLSPFVCFCHRQSLLIGRILSLLMPCPSRCLTPAQDSFFPKVASELPLRESRKLPAERISAESRILQAPSVRFRGNPPPLPSPPGKFMFKRTSFSLQQSNGKLCFGTPGIIRASRNSSPQTRRALYSEVVS